MKNPAIALLALLVLGAAPAVHAQDGTAYYGVSIGQLDYSEVVFGESFSDSTDSWRLMVRYQFMEYLGVEGSYGKTSTASDAVTFTSPDGTESAEVVFETDFGQILTIRLLGTLPFDNGLSLMAGVGYLDYEHDSVVTVDGIPFGTREIDDNRPAYYLGVQYDWDRIALRLGYEKFDLDNDVVDADVEEVSLTFFYKI